MSRYTKEWHRARIGSKEPALCGKKPPGNRPWKKAPRDSHGNTTIPECPRCRILVASQIWLAA